MLTIANPVYDAVFKYLMDDKRVAGIILSALLKCKIVDVECRKNEYPDATRDDLSIFRIDFGATVEEEDGSRHLVLVEIQKTWLPTETLRFRQYLGVQYSSRDNIIKDDIHGYALPMVTVYILGHKVGDIEEPVVYVKRNVYDYQGVVITKGIPNPFIESLTHDSIIVQIPYLRGHVNNRLEKILSVFDQSSRAENEHFLLIDDSSFINDNDMEKILFRLTSAASDSTIRHNMNVEDEYYGLIEERDTTILQQNQKLAEQGAQLKEQGEQLKEQGAQLKEQDIQIKEQGEQLKEKDAIIRELMRRLSESR